MSKYKTIFVSVFEGVEAKNLLRTGVVRELLTDPCVRVVLFVKSRERVQYYKREFNDPRIIYEVVIQKPPRGIDRLFAKLKFILLRTKTTDLKRRMAYDVHKNPIVYYGGFLANRLLARPLVQRLARALDTAFVRDTTYAAYFDRYDPDVVFLAHLFDEPEVHLLREAKRRGVPSIGFVNSWDKVTARCMLRIVPDTMLVFNEVVKDELTTYDAMDPGTIYVTGLPHYDMYVAKERSSREEFFDRISADPAKKLIVYAPMGRAFSNSDWDIIDLLESYNREGHFGQTVEMLIRFQPNDFFDEAELGKRPHLRYDFPGVRFGSSRGVDWDMNADDLAHLADTLEHMSLLICYASSMSVDAAYFDRPVININFEIRPHELLQKSPTQFYLTEHYQKALKTGGIRLVSDEEELAAGVREYLEHPGHDTEDRARLVHQQCQFIDGRSATRIAEHIKWALTPV